MSSRFAYHDQFFYVSNQRFFALIEFALEVAASSEISSAETAFVTSLRTKSNNFWPGYDLIVETEFPSIDERKFWARIFFDLAYLIFRREIGNQNNTIWQYSAVGDAYLLARLITRSVQEEEPGWHPKTLASTEAEIFYNKGVNVKL